MGPKGVVAGQQAEADLIADLKGVVVHAPGFGPVHIAENAVHAELVVAPHMADRKNGRLAVGHLGDHFNPGGLAQVKHLGFPVVRVQQTDLTQSAGPGGRVRGQCLGLLLLFPGLQLAQIVLKGQRHLRGPAPGPDLTVVEPHGFLAQLLDVVHTVGTEQQRVALVQKRLHTANALLLKRLVANRQHLVRNQDIGPDAGGHGKAQAHIHARGIGFDRLVDKIGQFGKGDNLRHQGLGFRALQAQHGRGKIDILPPGVFRVKTRAQLQQRPHPTGHLDGTGRGPGHAGDELEQGGFARAVAPDNAARLAGFQVQIHVPQGPEVLVIAAGRHKHFLEPVKRARVQLIAFAQIARADNPV